MLSGIRRRLLWFVLVPLLALGLYALAGFWLLPRIARAQAADYVRAELGKSLTLGELRFNPFTFRAEASDIAIRDPAPATARPLVALRKLALDFQVSSLWKGAYTFREVLLDGPYAHAIVRPDGSLNLAELLPREQDDEPSPDLLIEHLVVTDGVVDFADRSRRLQPGKRLAPIRFELRDFRTAAGEGGGFHLLAAGDQGERFDWQGRLSLSPFASDGQVAVEKLQARTAYEFLSEQLPLELSGGHFDVAGSYRFAVGTPSGTRLEVVLGRATASGLGLRAKGDAKDTATLPKVALEGARFSLQRQELLIDALRLDGLQAAIGMQADGRLDLQRLFAAGTGGAVPPAPARVQRQSQVPWTMRLGKVAIEAATIDFEDRRNRPASRFRLQPLSASAERIDLDLSRPVPIALATTINGKATLSLQGEMVPASSAAHLRLELAGLPLRDVQAYLPDFPKLELRSGEVAAKGELDLPAATERGPRLGFNGDATISRFSLAERASQREVMAWERVQASGVRYTQGPSALSIARVHARKPFAIVVVEADRTFNLANLFAGQAPASPQAAPAMAIRVDDVQLENGTMAFADYSIDPNFRARIEALRGHLHGLSTSPDTMAKVDLDGQIINRYSPVSIEGGLNPFAYDRQTDLKMSFRNIDLPIFNPYSGRFAGYAIAKGKLTTELHYKIDQRQLDATHHVVLDQLEWGQETDSKEKVSLPIRLATSLLKDRQGVIDLDLPITGSLDDPKFRVWPVVWQILKNIIVKIVMAPFDFIGSLFKGAENAQYVDFAAGSPALAESARNSLAALAKGLAERPALRLDIPAGAALETDADALAAQRLDEALSGLRKGEPVAVEAMEAKEQIDLLEKLYRQQLGRKPEIPETEAVSDEATRKEARAERAQADLAWLRQALLPHYRPGQTELEELGRARANAVQEALLASGELDPARVFVTAAKAPTPHEGSVRLELALE